MKSRGLLFAAVLLAVLSGLIWWSNKKEKAGADTKPAADAAPKILSLSEADITALTIKKKGQPDIALAKSGDGWRLTSAKALGADQQGVSSVLSTISSLNSEHLIE